MNQNQFHFPFMFRQGYREEMFEESSEERRSGVMIGLAKHAEKKFATLALAAGIFFGGMREARAEKGKAKPASAEKAPKAEAPELRLDVKIEKEVKNFGRVRYVSGAQGEQEISHGVRGEDTVTAVMIHSEGDPKVKGDEQDTEASFVRTDYIEHGEKKRNLEERSKMTGTIKPRENPFGYVSGFPESLRKSGDESLNQMTVNGVLQDFWQELVVLRGFRAVSKENTPEAIYAQEKLKEGIREFQKQYPDIPLPANVVREVFGDLR